MFDLHFRHVGQALLPGQTSGFCGVQCAIDEHVKLVSVIWIGVDALRAGLKAEAVIALVETSLCTL